MGRYRSIAIGKPSLDSRSYLPYPAQNVKGAGNEGAKCGAVCHGKILMG